MAFALPQAAAQTEPSASAKASTKATTKKTVKKKTTKKKVVAVKEEPASDKEDEKVDTTGLSSTHYTCELGAKVTIHTKPNNSQQITVSWRNRLHNLVRVSTTTGADRYEGAKSGLVWIGIPAKGMLLDAHKGQQLANECKDASQLKHST